MLEPLESRLPFAGLDVANEDPLNQAASAPLLTAATFSAAYTSTVGAGFFHTQGNQILDAAGNVVRIAGVNWFGMETTNYAPHGLWARGYREMMDQMKQLGFNTIRLPFSNQLFDTASKPNGIDFSKNSDLQGLSGLQIMDKIVAYAGQVGLKIILDHHRSSAGNGPEGNGLWYTSAYPESRWISDWKMLASRYAGNPTIIGADLHNEPHGGATWGSGNTSTDWRLAAERGGNAVLAINSNWLVVVEGIETGPSGYYWWGGNLSSAGTHPVRLNTSGRLVYSPHDYPASVYPQPWFNASNYPDNLRSIWDRNWGYLYRQNIAPILLGEFGSKLQTSSDAVWLREIVEYLGGDLSGDGVSDLPAGKRGPSWTWWSWNPNSGDTGGILKDDWSGVQQAKVTALQPVQFAFGGTSTPPPITNWGSVAFFLAGGQTASGDTSYTATATRTGTFTAEVLFAHASGNVDLRVYDANNRLLGSSATSNNGERVDVAVTAGQKLRIRVTGVNGSVTFRGTNLLTASGDTVTIGGTSADELFVFLPGTTTSRIAVNGVGYDFASNTFDNYIVQGGGSADTAIVVGTSATETATFSSGSVSVSSSAYAFRSTAAEFNTMVGNGGGDKATFSDTGGNDTFTGSPTQGVVSGAAYSNTANGFATVTATFSAGGYDQAFLYGSIGDDRFEASPAAAFVEGPGFRLNTSGYDTVVGVGGWGNDIAPLADSGGDETFIGQADAGSLSGSSFYLRAANFERIEARSSGGFDVAYLWDSAGDDYFGGSKVLAFLNGTGFSNYVESFDRVEGRSTGGNDTAEMYGAAGADQFFSNGRSRLIQAADYLVRTENFRTVRAYGGGGVDTAELQDLLSSHRITGRANWFRLNNADSVTGYDFEQVTAVARPGQRPTLDVAAIDYFFTRVGF